MIGSTDYAALGALITTAIASLAAAIVSIIVALRQTKIGAKVDEVHDQTATSNNRTLGEIVEANDLTGPPNSG